MYRVINSCRFLRPIVPPCAATPRRHAEVRGISPSFLRCWRPPTGDRPGDGSQGLNSPNTSSSATATSAARSGSGAANGTIAPATRLWQHNGAAETVPSCRLARSSHPGARRRRGECAGRVPATLAGGRTHSFVPHGQRSGSARRAAGTGRRDSSDLGMTDWGCGPTGVLAAIPYRAGWGRHE